MICKHCGYDVPNGIEYCTACGEPMPKRKEDETVEDVCAKEQETVLSKKEFNKHYVPYSVKLSLHAGAILSYFYTALSLYISIGVLILGKAGVTDIVLLVISVLLAILTAGFHIKKSLLCAVVITVIAGLFTIYSLVMAHQLTVVWLCAGILAIYGIHQNRKLWRAYQETGKLPPRVR
ncbi:MAG TPA: zinc ribbon domain-containing protein [Clostridiales bacterium]|nr:zinc ribbon domain-containing protein [Clostridiales bacterium]